MASSQSNTATAPFAITYHFRFDDGSEKTFNIKLDNKTSTLIEDKKETYPEWTKLECQKCAHCPIPAGYTPYCPIAKNIVDVLEFFASCSSHSLVNVTVTTPDRSYIKKTELDKSITSLLGIYMVTSGCPIMDQLRPIVRFHLPFATGIETKFRAMAMHLLSQYFTQKKGKPVDWSMTKLTNLYKQVNRLNLCFSKRLNQIDMKDSALNAITNLDCFAYSIHSNLDDNMFDDLEFLFDKYINAS